MTSAGNGAGDRADAAKPDGPTRTDGVVRAAGTGETGRSFEAAGSAGSAGPGETTGRAEVASRAGGGRPGVERAGRRPGRRPQRTALAGQDQAACGGYRASGETGRPGHLAGRPFGRPRSEEHTSELQSRRD